MEYKSIGNIPLNINKGEELKIKIVKQNPKPPFLMCGNGEPIRCKGNSIMAEKIAKKNAIDMAEELMKFTDVEKFAFKILYKKVKQRYYDEVSNSWYSTCVTKFIASGSLSNTEKVKFSKGIRKLIDKKLIAKLGRSKFIINPNMIITSRYESDINIWNELDNK